MYDLCMRVIIAISLFNKDAGLHAILILTIEAWGRCVLNRTLLNL